MGDRVSISFVNGDEESITMFDHWGGKDFPALARDYVEELKKELNAYGEKVVMWPLTRLEPNTVMVDFVRWMAQNHLLETVPDASERVWSRFYFGKDENDGDNSDNGHFKIDLG